MNLLDFFSHYNILGTTIATSLGFSLSIFLNSFVNDLIIPIINIIIGKNIRELKFTFAGKSVNIGMALSGLISYIIVLFFIIFVMYMLLYSFTEKVKKKQTESDEDMLNTEHKMLKELQDIKGEISKLNYKKITMI